MLKEEFENRTKMTITDEEYPEVDALYMACGDIDKDDFCEKYITMEGRLELLHKLERVNHSLHERINSVLSDRATKLIESKKQKEEFVRFLLQESERTDNWTLYHKAQELVGDAEVIRRKIKYDLKLNQEDLEFIASHLIDTPL